MSNPTPFKDVPLHGWFISPEGSLFQKIDANHGACKDMEDTVLDWDEPTGFDLDETVDLLPDDDEEVVKAKAETGSKPLAFSGDPETMASRKQHMRAVMTSLHVGDQVTAYLVGGEVVEGMVGYTIYSNVLVVETHDKVDRDITLTSRVELHESALHAVEVHKTIKG